MFPKKPRSQAVDAFHGLIRPAADSPKIVFWAAPAIKADVVTDWNTAALAAIRALNTPPPAAARNLAILHTSIYDAINGIRRTPEPYFVIGHVPTSASIEAAASAAGTE